MTGTVLKANPRQRSCLTCAHYRYARVTFWQRICGQLTLEGDRQRCAIAGYDPVTGVAKFGYCYIERAPNGACGPAGMKWEPRK